MTTKKKKLPPLTDAELLDELDRAIRGFHDRLRRNDTRTGRMALSAVDRETQRALSLAVENQRRGVLKPLRAILALLDRREKPQPKEAESAA